MSKKYVIVGVSALALAFGGTALAGGDEDKKNTDEQAAGADMDAADVETVEGSDDSAASAQGTAAASGVAELSKEQKKQLQRELKNQGHYQGAIDGIVGPQTRAALKRFQAQQNLTQSGELDEQTISALGLDMSRQPVSGSEDPSAQTGGVQSMQGTETSGQSARSFQLSALNEQQVQELQQKLKDLGHYRGEVDGKVGPMTRAAMRRYFNAQAALASRGMVSESALEVFGLEASEIQSVGGEDQAPQGDMPGAQPKERQPSGAQPSESQPSGSGSQPSGSGSQQPSGSGSQQPSGSGSQQPSGSGSPSGSQ